uniref:Uncharacterized protein n=1 Tax=Arundo donax TaxID=35708 RepID=A0A0A9CP56_ARUDO
MNWDFVPCVIPSISAAIVKDFRASSVRSSNLQWKKSRCDCKYQEYNCFTGMKDLIGNFQKV